jgi:outer membrane lipopolysaccharide assembly protein LptE/RlpB
MHWLNLKSVAAILAAAIAAGTGTHLVQQRETNRLRNENKNLVAQQGKLTNERDAALLATTGKNDEVEQFKKDKNELLRLRSEVGALRRQIAEFGKLRESNGRVRDEKAAAQNPVAAVPSATQEADARQIMTNTVNAMKQISLAVRFYAQEHHNEFPTNMNQITNNLPPRFADPVKLESFEFVSHAMAVNWRSKPDTIIVRERVARQTSEGKWARVYGLIDGHVIEQISDDDNFESWEAQHRVLTAPAR